MSGGVCERITGSAPPDRVIATYEQHRINGEKREDGRLIVRCGYRAEWAVQFLGSAREHLACSGCLAAVCKMVGSHTVVRTLLPLTTFAQQSPTPAEEPRT